jgi:hypothetical protein
LQKINLDLGFLGKCRRLERFCFPVPFCSMDTVLGTHLLKEKQSGHEADP